MRRTWMRARLGEKMFVGIKTNGSEMVTTASFGTTAENLSEGEGKVSFMRLSPEVRGGPRKRKEDE